jgi:hypothetical protein
MLIYRWIRLATLQRKGYRYRSWARADLDSFLDQNISLRTKIQEIWSCEWYRYVTGVAKECPQIRQRCKPTLPGCESCARFVRQKRRRKLAPFIKQKVASSLALLFNKPGTGRVCYNFQCMHTAHAQQTFQKTFVTGTIVRKLGLM